MKIKKNYIKLGLIIFATVIVTLLICNIYKNFEGNKSNSSYIAKHVSTIQYNELLNALTELSDTSLVYISYIGDIEVYNLEKQMKKVLEKSDLLEDFIHVDATEFLNDKKTVKNINEVLNVKTAQDIVLPAVIYYKDNVPYDYIDSSRYLFQIGSLSQLIDKYELGNK